MQPQPQIAYLAEPSSINNNFNLKGKSLRCYEVEVTYEQHHSYTRLIPKGTGVMYTLKDGKLVKSKSKASMSSKYISHYYNSHHIKSTIDTHSSWGSSLYTTPELAILAKLHNIQRDRTAMYKALAESKAKLDALSSYSDSYFALAADYPELLI